MIDVPELDLYIKTFFYYLNSGSEIYRNIDFSEELKSRISFLKNNQGILVRFQNTVTKPEFGFTFGLGRANSMYGIREVVGLFDPYLTLPAKFLKIYPRLLYSHGFLTIPTNFENYKYFFRYYPKMIVQVYKQRQGTQEVYQETSTYWVLGTHSQVSNENHISYNVAVEVNLDTIIEEELHGQIEQLHSANPVADIVRNIQEKMPELKLEIEQNLNRILTTEEKKFQDLGDVLRIENASELRILDQFVTMFEAEVMESTQI